MADSKTKHDSELVSDDADSTRRSQDDGSDPSAAMAGNSTTSQRADDARGSAKTGVVFTEQPTQISARPPVPDPTRNDQNAPTPIAHALVGQRLLHFEIEQFVGGGGMGAVFRGRDTQLGRTVAVKLLSPDNLDDDTVRRFRNEAQSAARLDHPNIPDVYFVGEHDGWHFIVFEFVDGQNIRDLVAKNGPLPVDEVLCHLAQLAEALQHAGSRDVVHRDIKPSNVLITPEGRATLVDMGLARSDSLQSSAEDLTATGVTLGTFDYISPEQARDPREADARSDIYSLGCTVYYMLTGRPPFPEGTVLQKLLSHTTDAPTDPRQFRDDLPEGMTRILATMLEKLPDDRYQSADELLADALLLAEQRDVFLPGRLSSTIVVEREIEKPRSWRQHIPWIVPSLMLIATVLLLELGWAWRGQGQAMPKFVLLERQEGSQVARQQSDTSSGSLTVQRPAEFAASTDGSSQDSDDYRYSDSATGIPATRVTPPSLSVDGMTPGRDSRAITSNPDGMPSETYQSVPDGTQRVIVGLRDPGLVLNESDIYVDSLKRALLVLDANESVETIEIRQSRIFELDRLEFDNRRIAIRAAAGYRPRIVFRPDQDTPAGDHSLIQMVGGQLRLEGLDVVLEVPQIYAEQWSLFELKNVDSLQLQDSVVTIKNSLGGRGSFIGDVAVFELSVPPGGLMPGEPLTASGEATQIELQNCVVLCEASLLKAEESLPFRLTWSNGLFVTTEWMLHVGGTSQPESDRQAMSLDLRNVTAVMDRGMCRVTGNEDTGNQLMLNVRCSSCVLVADERSPLFSQRGVSELPQFRRQLIYHGERNRIGDVAMLWRIDARNGRDTDEFDFARWEGYWREYWRGRGSEPYEIWGPIAWARSNDSTKPVHEHNSLDYRLSPVIDPGGGTARLSDVGARFDRLPPVWPAPTQ